MPDSHVLGDFEQLVLLGVLQSGSESYGVPIWRELERRTGRRVSLGAVYKTLDRLENKGLLRSAQGQPTSERGGRSKRVYRVTPSGLRLLNATLAALARMAQGLELELGRQ
jgi:PadR family transcriptional regulator, regulatory protein PadR